MLCNLKYLLDLAVKGSYAVGAFNVQNLEFAKGIIDAAEEHPSPLIMQITPRSLRFFGFTEILDPCLYMAQESSVPICVHLDHAKDLAIIQEAIRLGFTSVMFDGSHLPLSDNIRLCQQVVSWSHEKDISVEAEVGMVGNDEDDASKAISIKYSKPEEVNHFCAETKVDALAVSLGSIHGMKTASATLDLDLLQKIASIAPVPLVLHGSSGVQDEMISQSIALGIRKINVATRLKQASAGKIYEISRIYGIEGLADTLNLSMTVRDAIKDAVLDRLRLFNPSHII